ncbi:MAG: metallophosphoesterase family protein [Fidelibacterota bacterium]
MNRGNTILRKSSRTVFMAIVLALMLVIPLFNCSVEEPVSFIVAQDQRYKATEEYHHPEYFMGALLAIKEVGPGDFMLSPGDLDPMYATRELVAEILGADYPWYPAVVNHDMEDPETMAYFRDYNRNGNSLPHIVRSGPPGCEETTYSFEIGDCHVAVINVYYDGKSDVGTDGDVVPELLEWLEEDLKNTDKPFIFVAGHEPLVAQPDMDNGRVRHQGDSLDKYFRNAYKLRELLKKYNVQGIFNGHSHGSSVAKVNGLWQLDAGHAYGLERKTPERMYCSRAPISVPPPTEPVIFVF